MKKHVRRLLSLVLAFCMVFALAACGDSGNSTTETEAVAETQAAGEEGQAAETEAAAASAADSGEMNIGIDAHYDLPALGMDPSTCFNYSCLPLLNIYDTLLRYDYESDSFKYIACDSYESSEDGMVWKFHIREGMTFHDGTPVNAEAVKFSFERTKNMGKGAAFIWDAVDTFEVEDEYTLVMNLSYPSAMDLTVCSPYAAYIMSPTAVGDAGEEFFADAVDAGSGPYYVTDRTGDSQIVLTAYDDYWDPFPEGRFDMVVFTQAAESSTRRQMLEGGEADFVWELPVEDIQALASNSAITEVKAPSFENLQLLINTKKEPLDNELVRQAISYAFPYDDIIDYVMEGTATKAQGVVPAGLWGHSDNVLQYNHDLDKAKELLSQAGYPDGGFSIELTYVTGDETERKCAELFQSELSQLGITLDIRPLTSDMFVEKGQSTDPDERQGLSFMWWYPDVPSPYTFLYTFFHTADPISWNWTYADDAELDAMMDEANELSATDRDASVVKYEEAQNYLMEKAYIIPILDKTSDNLHSSRVAGYVDDPCYAHVVFFHDCYRTE